MSFPVDLSESGSPERKRETPRPRWRPKRSTGAASSRASGARDAAEPPVPGPTRDPPGKQEGPATPTDPRASGIAGTVRAPAGLFAIFPNFDLPSAPPHADADSTVARNSKLRASTLIMLYLGRNHSYGQAIPLSDFSATCTELRGHRGELLAGRRLVNVEYDFYGRPR